MDSGNNLLHFGGGKCPHGRRVYVAQRTQMQQYGHRRFIIQIIKGEAEMTVGKESVAGKQGTWIQMAARTPHSIKAESPVVMLLTLLKVQT